MPIFRSFFHFCVNICFFCAIFSWDFRKTVDIYGDFRYNTEDEFKSLEEAKGENHG